MKNVARLSESDKRKSHVFIFCAAIGLLIISHSGAATYYVGTTYYVATTGNNANPGTITQPFASLQKGADVAVAGDTVFIRGGTYTFNGAGAASNAGINITSSGQSAARMIYFWAYPGEKPVFDFSGAKFAVSPAQSAGLKITNGNYLYFKGLEICNVPEPSGASNNGMWGDPISNSIIELCNFHNNAGPGLFLQDGTGGNLVLNCDSHDNFDSLASQGEGQNADGFGCHYQKTGTSTVFRGCRSWWNSDDGYDCINQGVAVYYENCWAMKMGYYDHGTKRAPSGNGNGFKAGGWACRPIRPAMLPRSFITSSGIACRSSTARPGFTESPADLRHFLQ